MEGHRLGRDHVLEGPTLETGEDGAIDVRRQLGPAQDGAAAGTAQGLVGGEGDHVGERRRIGVRSTRDEPGRMGGVAEEPGADLVGDRPEGLGVDGAGVGGGPGHDHLGTLGPGQLGDLVEVDALPRSVGPGRRHAVGDEAVALAAEVHRRAVGEVAALVEPHGQHGVARLQQGHVGGVVGACARVGLDVGVIGSEQPRCSLAGQVLDVVDDAVAAVVALVRDNPRSTCW